MKRLLFVLAMVIQTLGYSQAVPSSEENIPFLVTFGKEGSTSWGDDDFCQIFFFVVPETHRDPVYFRVYDPGIGGQFDEAKGAFDSKTRFSVYGGEGCISDPDAQKIDPEGNYKSGNLLDKALFGDGYDDKWYSFGPYNPTSGEFSEKYGGYVFKVICEGLIGDDGNLYRYFMSTSGDRNQEVEGGNAFTFEYTFRLHEDPKEVSHLYPYIDGQVISVKQANFDWDNDGDLKIVTNSRLAIHLKKSGNDNWMNSEHEVLEKEKESSFDVQFHKNKTSPAKNNNLSFYITNQYGESLPFFTIPIGGVPKPKSTIILTPNK